ncbi:hypothetical protein PVAP13_8NG172402 [Panicum virgatum]|uniref:Uncharacterized protein n=1 Tax=Panicum virgatum TaxID=38727 RepID=A0A8T0P7S8_PANVG|nr:hypothetical protein PVAP13_8NG172402 [Panicum virgatum]
MGEVDEGVPINGGEDEPAKNDARMKRRGGRCIWASLRAPSILTCHTVIDEEEVGEVDADVEVEARGRQALGDAMPISNRVNQKRYSSNISWGRPSAHVAHPSVLTPPSLLLHAQQRQDARMHMTREERRERKDRERRGWASESGRRGRRRPAEEVAGVAQPGASVPDWRPVARRDGPRQGDPSPGTATPERAICRHEERGQRLAAGRGVKIGRPGQSGSRREGGATAVDDRSSDLPAEGSSRQRQRPLRRAMLADPAGQCPAVPVGRRRGARRLLAAQCGEVSRGWRRGASDPRDSRSQRG